MMSYISSGVECEDRIKWYKGFGLVQGDGGDILFESIFIIFFAPFIGE